MTTSSPTVAASSIRRDVSSGSTTADDLSWTKGELFEQQDGSKWEGH
jgi:hypothetical protein